MKLSEVEFDEVVFCSPNTPIAEIVNILKKKMIRAVFIGDPENVVGMVSDQLIFESIGDGKDIARMKAMDIMRTDIPIFDINTPIEIAYEKSMQTPYGVFAIKKEGKVIGEISKKRISLIYSDLQKNKIYDLENRIKTLRM